MTRPRNVIACYVEGRSPQELERCGRALALAAPFRILPAAPAGWLVAVEREAGDAERPEERGDFVGIEGLDQLETLQSGRRGQASTSASELQRLSGDFAFLALAEHGELSAVRSCGGLVPLYYYVSPTAVCVATRLRDLFWVCPSELRADLLVHAIWSSGNAIFPENRSFFRDVTALPKGHFLKARPGQAKLERYWEPRLSELPLPSDQVQAEHALELRELLLKTLDQGLSRTQQNLLTLSGGVDSSSIAVLAARQLSRPLATLTFVAPSSSRARAVQLGFVEPLLTELGVRDRTLVDADNARLDQLFETPLASLCYCPHPALRLLPELGRQRFATLLSGHFADELCGYSQRLQDWVRHTRLSELFRREQPQRYGLRDGLRWGKRRLLNALGRELLPLPSPLGRVFAPELRAELGEWHANVRSRMLADPRPLRELAAWVELDGWIAMHWEHASVAGVVPLHPFFNRAALELGFRCHPQELFGPGPKKLLRRALGGLVPERYLGRQDKGHWRRPPRLEPAVWHGSLSELAGSVAPATMGGGLELQHAERRHLGQLALFEAAWRREGAIRSAIVSGSG